MNNNNSRINSFSPSVLTWNVRGAAIHNNTKSHNYNSSRFFYLRSLNVDKIDIIALQETKTSKTILEKKAFYSLPCHTPYFSSGETAGDGIALYIRKNLELLTYDEIIPGRLVLYHIRHPDTNSTFFVFNVYNYPSSTQNAQNQRYLLNKIQYILQNSTDEKYILTGDFNINLSMENVNPNSRFFYDFTVENGLTDYSIKLGSDIFTWLGDGRRAVSQSKLDYIFSKNFDLTQNKFSVIFNTESDHAVLLLTYQCPPPRTPLNDFEHIKEFLLSNSFVRENIMQEIIQYLFANIDITKIPLIDHFYDIIEGIQHRHINPTIINFLDDKDIYKIPPSEIYYGMLRIVADETFKTFKNKRNRKKRLFKKLQKSINKARYTAVDPDEIIDAKVEVKTYIESNFKIFKEKQQLRSISNPNSKSKSLYHILGRNNSKAISRIKNCQCKSSIKNCMCPIVTDPDEIVQVFTNHYKSHATDIDNMQNCPKSEIPGINTLLEQFDLDLHDLIKPTSHYISDKDFSKEEIQNVLRNFKNNTAPGPSCITKHTLLFLLEKFPNLFVDIINDLINTPDLCKSKFTKWIMQRKVIFIPKKSKNTLLPANHRPISLLETTYKLISKLLISRFEQTIFDT